MKPIARWTIGNTTPAGYECLRLSIESFTKLYDVEVVVCHNCSTETIMKECIGDFQLIDQKMIAEKSKIKPIGVAWKLYPPQIDTNRYEIVIDNDIVFVERIPEIDLFLKNDCTLLLEGDSRTYGRFEKFVPEGYQINSGIYGMPPHYKLHKYIDFYCQSDWEINATGQHAESKTFDEQGIISLALLNYRKYVIIPATSVTNCERELIMSKAMHFISLNRKAHHCPFALYKSLNIKLYL
jgi:hypothetical protein